MTAGTLSAGVVVLRGRGDHRHYLLLRAYRYWDFPKGLVEPGEEPLDAAVREVEEETTLTDLHFHWGHDFRETPPYGRGKVARYYVAETTQEAVHLPVSPELGRPEHDEYRWLPYQAARTLLPERVQAVLDWAHALTGKKSGPAGDRHGGGVRPEDRHPPPQGEEGREGGLS